MTPDSMSTKGKLASLLDAALNVLKRKKRGKATTSRARDRELLKSRLYAAGLSKGYFTKARTRGRKASFEHAVSKIGPAEDRQRARDLWA